MNAYSTASAPLSVPRSAATLCLVTGTVDRLAEGRRIAAAALGASPRDADQAHRGVHPDVIELIPPDGKERIGIAQVREMIRLAQFAPTQVEQKLCLIPQAEMLTVEAANALLKILEEPPRGLRFLLVAGNASDLLPTLVSRSRLFRVPSVPPAEFAHQLERAGCPVPLARWIVRLPLRDGEFAVLAATPGSTIERHVNEAAQQAAALEPVDLVAACVGDDPILRRQGLLLVLQRVATADVALLTTGIQALSGQSRETLTRFLRELLWVSFDAVRHEHDPESADDVPLQRACAALSAGRLVRFCLAIDDAYQAHAVYGPTEGILLSLFLPTEGDRNGR